MPARILPQHGIALSKITSLGLHMGFGPWSVTFSASAIDLMRPEGVYAAQVWHL